MANFDNAHDSARTLRGRAYSSGNGAKKYQHIGLSRITAEGMVKSSAGSLHYYCVDPDTDAQKSSAALCLMPSVPVPQDARCTVVFIHGFTLAARSFFLQVEHIRETQPHVRSLLFDLRGHGASDIVPEDACTVDGIADDAAAVIQSQAAEGPIILVGHSLGGLGVFNFLRRFPALRERVVGVVLCATSIEALSERGVTHIIDTAGAEKIHDVADHSPEMVQKLREKLAVLLAPALATAVFKKPGVSGTLVDFHASMINATPQESIVGFFEDLREHNEVAAQKSLMGIPGHVIVGAKDHVTPVKQATRIAELWRDAHVTVLPNVGHMVILEDPDAVNNAIDALISRWERTVCARINRE